MNTSIPVTPASTYSWLAPLASTLGILLFFFFIDEGYYDFRWMADAGNWVVFFIYFIVLFPVQLGISEFILRKVSGSRKLVLMLLVIMPLTIVALMSLFYLSGQ